MHCWRACKDKRKLCENAPSVDAHKASQGRKKFYIMGNSPDKFFKKSSGESNFLGNFPLPSITFTFKSM